MLRSIAFIVFSILLLPIFLGAGFGEVGYTGRLPTITVTAPKPVASPLDTIDVPPGDLIVQFEGCTDTMVLPPYPSRPTISCGIDLGAIGTKNVKLIFAGIVPDSVFATLVTASKFKRPPPKSWLSLNQVRLPAGASDKAFRRAMALIWVNTTRGALDGMPDHLRTAVLSYAYHTGHLPAPCGKLKLMSSSEIASLLHHKGSIYVGSNSKAIRRRRSQEAKYIERNSRSTTVAVCRAPFSIPKT